MSSAPQARLSALSEPPPEIAMLPARGADFRRLDGQEHLVYEYPGTGDTTTFALNAAGDVTSQQTGSTTTPSTYIGHRLYTQQGADGIVMRFIYDSNGNLACKVPNASWTPTVCPSYTTWPNHNAPIDLESYSYDFKNRLISYHRYDVHGDLLEYTSYTYDALDRTISKTENHCVDPGCDNVTTTTTNSSYEGDSSRVIEENLPGLEKKTYGYDAFGSAISLSSKPNSQAPASRYSYLYDPGSSVSLLVDSSGAVEESYGYSAYGSSNGAISKKASGFSTGSVPTNPVRFQGKMFDSGSGSYDMGARRYSASAGRWLQQDFYADALDNLGLSMDPLTANRYAFLGANPVNYVEVDGHTIIPNSDNLHHPALLKSDMDELTLETSGFYKHQGKGLFGGLHHALNTVNPIHNFREAGKNFRHGHIGSGISNTCLGIVNTAGIIGAFATDGGAEVALAAAEGAGEAAAEGAGKEAVIHGNSLLSTKPQHLYEISNKETGEI